MTVFQNVLWLDSEYICLERVAFYGLTKYAICLECGIVTKSRIFGGLVSKIPGKTLFNL